MLVVTGKGKKNARRDTHNGKATSQELTFVFIQKKKQDLCEGFQLRKEGKEWGKNGPGQP